MAGVLGSLEGLTEQDFVVGYVRIRWDTPGFSGVHVDSQGYTMILRNIKLIYLDKRGFNDGNKDYKDIL